MLNTPDLFIAVDPKETTNITACTMAHHLGAKKTVAKIDNPEYLESKNQELFKQLGVDSLIYPELLAAKRYHKTALKCRGFVSAGTFVVERWLC